MPDAYSEDTRRLVADAIVERRGIAWTYAMQDAAAVLDVLAERGLLLPEGAEQRAERHYSPAHDGLVERRVITTPWSPIPAEPKEPTDG